ncbi:glutathione S-transferase omega-like 2 [[Candida] jaroonii]|uniref:Glutathione S-transferase omega-like 2 n=1 Tax=[Candida] jaroonii TaxID=467808 RepID=A0ACA9Y4H6_9ASCO|nr:glutathione S-transferase omega-like 2 [[Candida] jaroonii]
MAGASLAGTALTDKDGEFRRKASQFRNWITKDGEFQPEKGRYHLYVSYACPWAHRALITRNLQKLHDYIDVSVVHFHLDDNGWRFITEAKDDDSEGTIDHVYHLDRLSKLYSKANPDYEGRWTVPVLWDKKKETIVSNESAEIIRMLGEFEVLTGHKVDLYPEELKSEIDELNAWVYDNINNGVYKSGFATSQTAYESNVVNVFKYLDKAENILKDKYEGKDDKFYYLIGNHLTEADIRLFTTIIRFDPVYHQHFKCNIKMIRHDYPFINTWMKKLYWQNEAFKSTTDFDHIKKHYTTSHHSINPYGIVPLGPIPNILPL